MNIINAVTEYFKIRGYYNDNEKLETIINNNQEDILDMEWLFESFFKDFNIKNSHDFDVYKYFYDTSLRDKILIKLGINKNINLKTSITISHMIEVAKRKEWFDPQ
ncbi:hypothetical protein J2810_004787 [Chryseobacterium rhizosphaerae]|uniref:DUF1493 family protein n=1 Tax=Chryseobacterium rhizosphaerae TaxID=395937 RepID=UPI00285FC73F|nr:hypothetical protein [Chryseobacterium rhizosphaerae]MDR6548697.1 hypothetical protein [Chryseobacterium rhizosphaerae]